MSKVLYLTGLLSAQISFCCLSTVTAAPTLEKTAWRHLLTARQENGSGCQVVWRDVPLSQAAQSLDESCGMVVWIDRRLDPTTRIHSTTASPQPSASTSLALSAETNGWSFARYGKLIYLGPPAASDQLRGLLANRLEEVAALPLRRRREFTRRAALQWPRLTEPRRLIVSLLEERGFSITGKALIPHDRWGKKRLPAMPLAEQLTLLLFGFDLDWRPTEDGRGVVIRQAEAPTPLVASYGSKKSSPSVLLSQAKQLLGASAQLRQSKQGVVLTGSLSQHERLAQVTQRPPRASSTNNQTDSSNKDRWLNQRFTLSVQQQPAEALLRQLVKQIGLQLEIDRQASEVLASAPRISLEVRQATLAQLFDEIATGARVEIRRNGNTVIVTAPASNTTP